MWKSLHQTYLNLQVQNCTNTSSCVLPLKFWSEDNVVLEIPDSSDPAKEEMESSEEDPCYEESLVKGYSSYTACNRYAQYLNSARKRWWKMFNWLALKNVEDAILFCSFCATPLSWSNPLFWDFLSGCTIKIHWTYPAKNPKSYTLLYNYPKNLVIMSIPNVSKHRGGRERLSTPEAAFHGLHPTSASVSPVLCLWLTSIFKKDHHQSSQVCDIFSPHCLLEPWV